jgi:very-short-patch-repair endonuclease
VDEGQRAPGEGATIRRVSEAQRLSPEEALRRAGAQAWLSHESAARALGLDLLDPGIDRLTVPRSRSRLVVPGWRVIRADVAGVDAEVVDGLRCTAPVRTVLDLSRRLPLAPAVVAADSAVRNRLAFHVELVERLAGARGRDAARARAVAAAMDPKAESVLETLLRLVLRGAGFQPVTQYEIRDADARFVARVDFCWPAQRLVVEADGFAFHADRAAYRRDRERLKALERLGWRVLRFTWEDVRMRPEHVITLGGGCLDALAA